MPEPQITLLRTPGRAPRVLTIDAEDWFHVCGEDYYADWRRWDSFPSRIETTLTILLDLLEEGGHRATVFFLGWIARRRPHLVREALRRGHEVGVHGDRHRRADEMTAAEFRGTSSPPGRRSRTRAESGATPTAPRSGRSAIPRIPRSRSSRRRASSATPRRPRSLRSAATTTRSAPIASSEAARPSWKCLP